MSEDPGEAVAFEVELDAPPAKVWRALATPEIRAAWLGAPEAGEARVLAAEPGSRLAISWPIEGAESIITFEIAPGEASGTRLTVVHAPAAPAAQVVTLPVRAPRGPTMAACFRKAA